MDIDLKLDRVTISGGIYKHRTALTELNNALSKSRWEQISDSEFRLLRKNENGVYEHVAGLYANKFQNGSWRLDTSNHLQGDELQQILIPLNLMTCPHLTRIDVAFDIINGDLPNMAHRIFKFGTSERIFGEGINEYTGRAKQIQTIYAGTRKSEMQIRYYDKAAEQKSRRKELPDGVKKWERLEIQLRGKSIGEWKIACRKMLMTFKMPNYSTVKNAQERAMLAALQNHVVEYHELARATRTKFRSLLKSNIGLDDTYSQLLMVYFDEHVTDLENEIKGFFTKIGVNENK